MEKQRVQPYTVIISAYHGTSVLPKEFNVTPLTSNVSLSHLLNGVGTFTFLEITKYQNGHVTAVEKFGDLLESQLKKQRVQHHYVEYPDGPDYGNVDTVMIIGIPQSELPKCIDMLTKLFVGER